MYKQATTFDDINIPQNTLILCDIDETVIFFNEINEEWWRVRFNHHYRLIRDYDKADAEALNDWLVYIKANPPQHTDKEGFFRLLQRAANSQSEIIFVTARDSKLHQLTHEHFEQLDIDHKKYKIHYTRDKGKYIKQHFNLENYERVIFIDDRLYNLDDVVKHNPGVECFLFTSK